MLRLCLPQLIIPSPPLPKPTNLQQNFDTKDSCRVLQLDSVAEVYLTRSHPVLAFFQYIMLLLPRSVAAHTIYLGNKSRPN